MISLESFWTLTVKTNIWIELITFILNKYPRLWQWSRSRGIAKEISGIEENWHLNLTAIVGSSNNVA